MIPIPEDIGRKINDTMFMKGGNTDSEKDCYKMGVGDGYQLSIETIAEKDKEIQRLKELIEIAYDAGYACYDDIILTAKSKWQQFKSDNKL